MLALLVAAGFAALGQWQLGSAIQQQALDATDTELAVPLDKLTEAGIPVGDTAGGRVVAVSGRWVPEDFTLVGERVNQGEIGYWLVGHLVTNETPKTHVAVALGWSASRSAVEAAADAIVSLPATDLAVAELIGRYMPTEEPDLPDAEENPFELKSMSVPQQVNLWQPFAGEAYGGYIVSHANPSGLDLIDSVPPLPQETVNWLNLFYALEWVVFAGFALYFWYRVAKDAWVKECEDLDELAADASFGSSDNPKPQGQ